MSLINEFIDILSDLIAFRSIAINHEECRKTASYIADILKDVGFIVDVVGVKDGNPVVFAEMRGERKEALLFYNHYDVQPADPIEEWKTKNPFELTIKDDFLVGRGVGDNKGNIVSRILAVKRVLEEKSRLPYTVKFVIEGEEEMGSPHLWEALEKKKELFNNVKGVIWESGGYNRDDSITLILGLKGILYAELRARRLKRDAHSALAVILPSAIWDLIDFLTWLRKEKLKQIPSFHESLIDIKEIIDNILESGLEISFEEQTLKEEFDIGEFIDKLTGDNALLAYYGNPTFNIDGIVSGYIGEGQKTVLPKEAKVKIDFRLVPFQDPRRISEELCKLAKERNIECRILSMTYPAYTDFNHNFVQALIKFLQLNNQKVKIAPWSAGSGPMHYFVNNLELPSIGGIGVSYWSSRHHAPNENIRIKDVEKTIDLLVKLLNFTEIVGMEK